MRYNSPSHNPASRAYTLSLAATWLRSPFEVKGVVRFTVFGRLPQPLDLRQKLTMSQKTNQHKENDCSKPHVPVKARRPSSPISGRCRFRNNFHGHGQIVLQLLASEFLVWKKPVAQSQYVQIHAVYLWLFDRCLRSNGFFASSFLCSRCRRWFKFIFVKSCNGRHCQKKAHYKPRN